jgi:probable HAF family extracellular repeat protein
LKPITLAAVAAALIGAPAAAATTYKVTDLGVLAGGSGSSARGGGAGYVAGWSSVSVGTRAFLWDGMSMHNLGTLGGTYSQANGGLYTAGAQTTVGWSFPSGGGVRHAVYWTGTAGPSDLGAPLYGSAEAFDTNGDRAVGYFTTSAGAMHAFSTSLDSMFTLPGDDLGTLGGSLAQAYGVDAAGNVVGTSTTPSNARHGVFWSGGMTYDLTPWTTGAAFDIANVGGTTTIVGNATIGNATQAVRWVPNGVGGFTMTSLGAPAGGSSYAYGIDAAGTIVGTGKTSTGSAIGLLWPVGGAMTDINTLISPPCRCTVTDLRGVDGGYLVGSARFGAQSHAILLTANP